MATYKSIKYVIPVEAVEHTDSINALSDVDTVTAAPTDHQILVWSAADSKWYPGYVEGPIAAQKALFGFGGGWGTYTSVTNLVSSTGVVATDTTGVGTARKQLSAARYGGDKAIFGFGYKSLGLTGYGYIEETYNLTNLVSNTGVVATDTAGIGMARHSLAAAGYGVGKAIFGFGQDGSWNKTNVTNLVSNSGVVATDTTGVGTARSNLAAAGYGGDKALFGFGTGNSYYGYDANETNLVSNLGVVATDTAGVGTARRYLAAASYGGDKAIFGFGSTSSGSSYTNVTNLVSNTGVVATDTTGVGTGRYCPAASGYGGDKAIFGFGEQSADYPYIGLNVTNLVSNTGIVSSDVTGVGTARSYLAAAGYSSTA